LVRRVGADGGEGHGGGGAPDASSGDGRLSAVDQAFSGAVARRLVHLTAEDDQLNGRVITLDGRPRVNFGSCSYLGLETDLRLKTAACDAVGRYGAQFSSSRAYVSCPPYRELERLLATLFEAPLVVAPTTTLGHLAALPVLIGRGDAVICDQLAHSSIQALQPTLESLGAAWRYVRHNRMDRLDETVAALARRHARVWYLADGIYSMHGDTAPMTALHELARRHEQLHMYIDDAHGMSWTGRHGTGHVRGGDAGVPPRTVVAVSMGKAFGAGGAVLTFPDAESARLVRTCGSTLIFSGPMQPALVGAAIASAKIHLSPEIHERQRKLRERIRLFNTLAAERGLSVGSPAETPIRFVATGDNEATYRAATRLMEEGFYVNTALFPAVSRGRGGVRIALTVHQTLDDVRALIDTFARLA
jgi:7-keto-8-aminopelargonate synthetase-like enzyme